MENNNDSVLSKILELYNANYKTIKIRFYSYYKYEFYFKGENKDVKIVLTYGGNTHSIYKLNINIEMLIDLCPFEELNYQSISITDKKSGCTYDYDFDTP